MHGKRKTRFAIVPALALVAGLSAPAAAQDIGIYAGIALGQASVDIDCTGTTSCDEKDTSWKIFGGYQFSRNLALEVAYSNFGEASASTPPFGIVPAARVTFETSAFELVGVGMLPLADRFSAYAKLGFYRAETDIDTAFAGLGTVSDSDDNFDLTFGIGARFDITRNLGVRAEWQRYVDVKAADFGKSDIDVISLGALWRF